MASIKASVAKEVTTVQISACGGGKKGEFNWRLHQQGSRQTFDVDFCWGPKGVLCFFDGNLGISNHANMLILGLVYGSWIWEKQRQTIFQKRDPFFQV